VDGGEVVLGLGLVGVGAALDQQLDDVRVAFEAGHYQGRGGGDHLAGGLVVELALHVRVEAGEGGVEAAQLLGGVRVESVGGPDGTEEAVVGPGAPAAGGGGGGGCLVALVCGVVVEVDLGGAGVG